MPAKTPLHLALKSVHGALRAPPPHRTVAIHSGPRSTCHAELLVASTFGTELLDASDSSVTGVTVGCGQRAAFGYGGNRARETSHVRKAWPLARHRGACERKPQVNLVTTRTYNHDGSQSVLGVHGRAVTCQLAAEARPSPAALFSTNKSCGLPSRVKTADVAGPAIRPPR